MFSRSSFVMEPPGLKSRKHIHGEMCLNCRFLTWVDSKPLCGKFDFPVMHSCYCEAWESDGKFSDIGPTKPPPMRAFRDKNRGE